MQSKPPLQRSYTDGPKWPRSNNLSQAAKKAHLISRHHNHHHIRHGAKEAIKSAAQLHPPTTFPDVIGKSRSRSKERTPTGSTIGSRSPSVTGQDNAFDKHPTRIVGPEDLSREKEHASRREDELRRALHDVSELSHSSTRRLDDTYYSTLEKLYTLQSTIESLQELSNGAKKLYEDFQHDTDQFDEEMREQTSRFQDFGPQQTKLEDFESRIKAGKDRAGLLSAKLDEARKRVEVWEKQEMESRATTSWRMRVLWRIAGGIIALALALLILTGSNQAINSKNVLGQFKGSGGWKGEALLNVMVRPHPKRTPD